MIAAGAALGVQLLQCLGQASERGVVVEGALYEAEPLRESVPDLLSEGCAGVLFHRIVDDLAEILVGPISSGETDKRERGGQQSAVAQVVDRRHQLLAGQIAGDAEDHDTAGARDPGHPLIALVAQRVTPVCHLAAASS